MKINIHFCFLQQVSATEARSKTVCSPRCFPSSRQRENVGRTVAAFCKNKAHVKGSCACACCGPPDKGTSSCSSFTLDDDITQKRTI